MSEERFQSFSEFWPFYLREHSDPTNRRWHQLGTTMALGVVATAIARKKPGMIPLALVAGYGPAWVGHFIIEKNRPATFKYPVWSLIGDFKMNGMMWSGTLEAELQRLGLIEADSPSEAA